MKRLGYWFSGRKNKKLNLPEQEEEYRDAGIELVQFDVNQPMEEQGPFDGILHKLVDLQAQADAGCLQSQQQMSNVMDYISQHPQCVVIDPISSMIHLLDRYNQYRMVIESQLFKEDTDVFLPTFVELTSGDVESNRKKLAEAQVTYPIVCKPSIAHGSKTCHKMAIVFRESGLSDLVYPCVAQSFINHNALLFKIYSVGEKQYIAERPSLKNFYAGDYPTVFFDTHNVSKRGCSHYLTILDKADLERPPVTPDLNKLRELGSKIRQIFKCDLFGVDVIMDVHTRRYAIIDINSFPGYDEVDDFPSVLLEYLIPRLGAVPPSSSSLSSDSERDQLSADHQLCDPSSSKRLKPDREMWADPAGSRLSKDETNNHFKVLESLNGIHGISNSMCHVTDTNQFSSDYNNIHTNGHH